MTPDPFADQVRRARTADLHPLRTVADHSASFPDLHPIGNAFTRRIFDGPFYASPPLTPGLPSVNLVFVQSKDGNTGAPNPSVLGGGDVDLHVIYEGLSRVTADGVMSGSATLCGSGQVLSVWHPEVAALRSDLGLPRHPAQIIVSDVRLNLTRERFANDPDLRVFVVTTPRGLDRMRTTLDERPWIRTVVLTPEDGIAGALRVLAHDHAIRRISCIGGATTATALLDSDAVSDLYLTTGAKEGGEPGTPYYRGKRPPKLDLVLRKEGTGPDRGVVFEHFRVRPGRG